MSVGGDTDPRAFQLTAALSRFERTGGAHDL